MIFLIILTVLLIIVGIAIYSRKLLTRIVQLFVKKPNKAIRITITVISIIFGVFSINIFSSFGIIMLHIIVISLITEIINLFVKKKKSPKWEFVYKACLIPVTVTIIIFAIGYVNVRNIIRTDYTVETDKYMPESCRILMISDAHYGTIFKKEKLDELMPSFNAENADIVVLVGDIIDESTTKEEMQQIFETFGNISSKYGIYFVYGNHDEQNYSGSKTYTAQELRTAIESSGITILEDEYIPVNDYITIAGRKDYSTERKDITEVLSGADKNDFVLLLDHQPTEYNEAEKSGTDLILSGHTHAGQIFPAGYFIAVFKTSEMYYGHKQVGNMDAIVSAGISGWGYPIRTQNNSEYVIIDVVSKQKT